MTHCRWNAATWSRLLDGRYSVELKHSLKDHTAVYRWGRDVESRLTPTYANVEVEELPAEVQAELGFLKVTADDLLHVIDAAAFRELVEVAATLAVAETAELEARDREARKAVVQAWST